MSPVLPFPSRLLSVGARRVSVERWLEPAMPGELAQKRATLDAHPEAVAWLPGSEAAQAELAALVGADGDTIEAAGRAVVDDLCLLTGDDHRLVAGVLAAPNRWRLQDKLGLPLVEVHGQVPGYAEVLGRPVQRVIDALAPGQVLERRNWSVLDDAALYQSDDAPQLPADIDPQLLTVRSERQTLRRLPVTGAVVFTIRTRQWPLSDLVADREQSEGLLGALEEAPDDFLTYKGLALAAEGLATWLRARSGDQ